MKNELLSSALALTLMCGSAAIGEAATVSFDVAAQANSVSGGVGLATGFIFNVGDPFAVIVDPADTWSLGSNSPASRESNADGLPFYGNFASGGFTALFGSLVGRIGSGDFFLIGTNTVFTAASAGELLLYTWDSNNGDNSGSILATVTDDKGSTVPIPGAVLLLGSGLLGLAAAARQRKST